MSVASPRLRRPAAAYLALTKPRIIELLLVTTVPTMVVAARGIPSGWLVLATVAGGALAAGGANTANMYIDRDIDAVMGRTKGRPLVTGEVSPRSALVFAIVLEAAAFVLLWLAVNPLSAALAVAATAFYVLVYTVWLKRTSRHNIVIGGAAGAVPTLVGWAAVRGHLDIAPLILFGVIFVWTPPHFWSLAVRYRDDYRAAHVPMLPAVAPLARTARQIVVYTVALWVLSLLFARVAGMGLLYVGVATVVGAVFVAYAIRLWQRRTPAAAMRVFGWSITYLMVLFAAMGADTLVRAR